MVFWSRSGAVRPIVGTLLAISYRGRLGKQTAKLEELLRNNPISNKSSREKLDSFYHKIAVAYALADTCCLFGSVAYLSYQSGIKNTLEAAKSRVSFDSVLSTDQSLSQVKKTLDKMNRVMLAMNGKITDLEEKMDSTKLSEKLEALDQKLETLEQTMDAWERNKPNADAWRAWREARSSWASK
ncbi:hypothetical protein M0R45_037805 [Rubus argutus]|uniref:Uncharacterized protein n=1 Tax=Rubus argutus TaxID=59490 RepID=A0AAW1W367_RUBAR